MAFSRRGERDRCHATPQRIYPLDRPRAAPALGADASPIARIAGLAAATGRARGRTGPLRRSRHTTRPLKPHDLSRTARRSLAPCRRAGALPIGCQLVRRFWPACHWPNAEAKGNSTQTALVAVAASAVYSLQMPRVCECGGECLLWIALSLRR